MTSPNINVSINVESSVSSDVTALVVLVHKGEKSKVLLRGDVPDAYRDVVESLARNGLVTGKSNEVCIQLIESGKRPLRLMVVGLGNPAKFSGECLREAGGVIARQARKHRVSSLSVILPDLPPNFPGTFGAVSASEPVAVAIDAMVGAILLAAFDYTEYKGTAHKKKGEDQKAQATAVTIVAPADVLKSARVIATQTEAIVSGQNFARLIASRPGNDINPPTLAKVARDMAAEVGLTCRILDEKQLAGLKMGGILAVGAGSIGTPPRLIVLEHRPAGRDKATSRKKSAKPILLVGKAITFDTGGISIKPAEKMGRMIYDKCGGMTVLGVMYALAKLKLPVHVVGILSAAENHISSRAYRPGDILRMYNGVTVEVTNTDAEGRLVLGDALAWGIEQYDPRAVVDLATLTGGVVVALGKSMAGVMSNDDALVDALTKSGQQHGETIWRLPLGDDQRDQIKSDHADIVNSAGREGHPLQGGAFLSHFVKWEGDDRIPWAHLDIAGVADTEREMPYYSKGATGWGVRTLIEWIRRGIA